jgi:hypothetical protein
LNNVTTSALGALIYFGIFFGVVILLHPGAAIPAEACSVDIETDEKEHNQEDSS